VTLKLNGEPGDPMPQVRLLPTEVAAVTIGPVRVPAKREVCWNIQARAEGQHRLTFEVDGQTVEKELAIGNGFTRVSLERPGPHWSDILLHPEEKPFDAGSPVQSIEIVYPERSSWVSGSNTWVIYWFIASMIGALCFRRWLNVNI